MEQRQDMKALFVVINAGFAEEVVGVMRGAGAKGATILNSRSEGVRHESFMGITMDSEKEMILCVMAGDVADNVMAAVKEKSGVDSPANSVCFTMPVDKVVGINASITKHE